jgi:hypothetical protein
MNKRIRKKKQKLAAMRASKYKYAKLGRKRVHATGIETRHCAWGLGPHNKDCYAMYLRRRRRRCWKLEPQIVQHPLPKKSCLMMYQEERKEVKEKLFVKEGNYNG